MHEENPIGSHGTGENNKWQQDVINRLAFAALNEQKRTRRWGIFFKALLFAYLFMIFMVVFFPQHDGGTKLSVGKHTALIEISGVIADNTEANADSIITGLRDAFKDKNTMGVILRINSPGGSPVQSGYINDEIGRLRKLHPDTKVYAVITDICASGGYYIAAAADEIYADKASVVGSIGVIMNGFGFVDTIDKLGIERRLYTSGEHKGFLDPFSKENPVEVAHIKSVLKNIHQQFIDVVKQGRGERLKDDPRLFSGFIWSGEESLKLGLVDALGSSSYVAREIIKEEKIVNFTPKPNYLDRFAERFGAAMANTVTQVMGLEQGNIK
ncbi:MAG: S49 family peptidase [Gammaproteobacteria bacterium]|nr:S49 family peptidase [Gammaproteobacteria bacterium]